MTSLHIVLGTQGQDHALDTSGAYLGKPCFYINLVGKLRNFDFIL